jgi:2-polyprenyl-3-methyl-5-hydroxy-6-metoxy-1,4-benzoquinol methylase
MVWIAPAPQRACPLCGCAAITPRERRGSFRYGQCAYCLLAFVLNPPTKDQTIGQYNAGVSSKLAYYRLAATADARSFDALLTIVQAYSSPSSILDVGCNIGTFVRVAQRRGWSATGVDLNREAIEYGRTQSGLNLLTVDEFESMSDRCFDVIHSSDTIEHFTDPVNAMRSYANRLKPRGLLAVSTPNYDSALCKLFQLKPTEHLFLFNKQSLSKLFELVGLHVVATYAFDRYRNISAMFESTTFDGSPRLQYAFKAIHRVAPQLLLRIPGGENLLVIARAAQR